MANTTADKLALLEATKADLKAALADQGIVVGNVFSTYPEAVRAIKTGRKVYVGTHTTSSYKVFVPDIGFTPSIVLAFPDDTKEYQISPSSPRIMDYCCGVYLINDVQMYDTVQQGKSTGGDVTLRRKSPYQPPISLGVDHSIEINFLAVYSGSSYKYGLDSCMVIAIE